MKDEEIVELFWKRSEDAVREAQLAYRSYCMTIAMNILENREDAEECLNDALHAAWNSIPPHRPESLSYYLGKLTREISISLRRKKTAQKRCPGEYLTSLEEMEEIACTVDFDDEMNTGALGRAISDFLWTLPRVQREMFVRRYWFNDSIDVICIRFGFRQSKVKVSLMRTRDKLRQYLQKKEYIE